MTKYIGAWIEKVFSQDIPSLCFKWKCRPENSYRNFRDRNYSFITPTTTLNGIDIIKFWTSKFQMIFMYKLTYFRKELNHAYGEGNATKPSCSINFWDGSDWKSSRKLCKINNILRKSKIINSSIRKSRFKVNLGFFSLFLTSQILTYLLCRGFGPVRTLLFSAPKNAPPFSCVGSPNLEPFLCNLTAFVEEKEPFLSLDNLPFPSARHGFFIINSRRIIVHKPAASNFPIKPMNFSAGTNLDKIRNRIQ